MSDLPAATDTGADVVLTAAEAARLLAFLSSDGSTPEQDERLALARLVRRRIVRSAKAAATARALATPRPPTQDDLDDLRRTRPTPRLQ